jgi:CTP:molybdopterin cytidylyltransferase MocA
MKEFYLIPLSPLILLCAGRSERMLAPKGLLLFKNRPWIIEQLFKFKECGGIHVIIVLGFDSEVYLQCINAHREILITEHFSVSLAQNPIPSHGNFSSLKVGLAAFLAEKPDASSFVIPIDVPCPKQETWLKLQQSMHVGTHACVPFFQKKGGHPVLLSRHFMTQLVDVHDDEPTARLDMQIKALHRDLIKHVTVQDSIILYNLNSLEDWQKFLD